MSIPKITITQAMAVTAFVACLIALWQIPENGYQTIWKKDPLVYRLPTVPEFYLDPAHLSPINPIQSTSPATSYEFKDGRELYLSSHREGWDLCRGWFYGSASPELLTLTDVTDEKPHDYEPWQSHHVGFARQDGYETCCEQLAALLETSSANKLRGKLAYSAYWQKVPICILALVSLWFTGVHLFVIRYLKHAELAINKDNEKSGA